MKPILILLGVVFVLSSCQNTSVQDTPATTNETSNQEKPLDEATLRAMEDPVKPDPNKPMGVTMEEAPTVPEPEKPIVDEKVQSFYENQLVGTWETLGNEARKVQLNTDGTFQFNISDDVFMIGDVEMSSEEQVILHYGVNEIMLNVVSEGSGYRLMNNDEKNVENFVKQ